MLKQTFVMCLLCYIAFRRKQLIFNLNVAPATLAMCYVFSAHFTSATASSKRTSLPWPVLPRGTACPAPATCALPTPATRATWLWMLLPRQLLYTVCSGRCCRSSSVSRSSSSMFFASTRGIIVARTTTQAVHCHRRWNDDWYVSATALWYCPVKSRQPSSSTGQHAFVLRSHITDLLRAQIHLMYALQMVKLWWLRC